MAELDIAQCGHHEAFSALATTLCTPLPYLDAARSFKKKNPFLVRFLLLSCNLYLV